jgi:uncharacterized repeat protein (TIGR01451 family)
VSKKLLVRIIFVAFLVVGTAVLIRSTVRATFPEQETPPPWLDPENFASPLLAQSTPQSALSQPEQATGVKLPWSKIVFQSFRDGNWEIYAGNDDGSGQIRLTNNGASDIHPHLNRGTTRITFASNQDGDYEIYTVNTDGSGLTKLTSNFSDDVNPVWSPDGTKIAFEAYRDGQAEIYVMNANGSAQTRLTVDGDYDGMPDWSPDGTKIAFVSRRTGGYRIYTMTAAGIDPTQIPSQPYSFRPTWSPDGKKIAFDADGNNDGWQELWVMNSDGTNQFWFYSVSAKDIMVGSWSPDGNFIGATEISYIYYNGNWYWTQGNIFAISNLDWITKEPLSPGNTDWNPHWQTKDIQAPSSQVSSLPLQSPGPVRLSWSGVDTGGSGVRSYDVQVKEGNSGIWVNWLIGVANTYGEYPGIGGRTYAFRSRAHDNAFNTEPWAINSDATTTVENIPPETAVSTLYPFTKKGNIFPVNWSGIDPGNSGIQNYDIQYRIGNSIWADWLVDTSNTSDTWYEWSGGEVGETVYFRSRAVDFAQNQEVWPTGDGDTATTFYRWGISGTAYDNTDTPISGVNSEIYSNTLGIVANTPDGKYGAYTIISGDTYSVTWDKPELGSLPATNFPGDSDAVFDVYLPPVDNVWVDGGFESGTLNNYTPGIAEETAVITNVLAHTGNYAAYMGTSHFFNDPTQISDAPAEAAYPQAKFDSSGVLHVVWRNNTGPDAEIYYASRDTNGNWSSPMNISNENEWSQPPQLQITQDDVVHVVWGAYSAISPYRHNIYYTRRATNGTWNSPELANGQIDVGDFRFVASDNNEVHFLWKHDDYWQIYYSRRAASGTWDAPYELTPKPNADGPVALPRINIDLNNNVHVVWKYHIDVYPYSFYSLQHQMRTPNGQWITYTPIVNKHLIETYDVELITDHIGQVHVIWLEGVASYDYSLYHSSFNGSQWATPHHVADMTYYYYAAPDATIDQNNNLHLVWVGDGEIYYISRSSTGTWSTIQNLSNTTPNLNAIEPQITSGENQIFATWTTGYYPDFYQIYVAQKPITGAWSSPIPVATSMTQSSAPQIAVTFNEQLHVIWHDGHIGYSDSQAEIFHVAQTLATKNEDIAFSQRVTLPLSITNPILSYVYKLTNASIPSQTGLMVDIDDGISNCTVLEIATDSLGWGHSWVDLSAWSGKQVTVTFNLHEEIGKPIPQLYIDEVSLGSTYPDVWIEANSTNAPLGAPIFFTLTYGNRGGAWAPNTIITFTLPAEIDFISANVTPASTSPLTWNMGTLPPKNGLTTLEIVGTTSTNTDPFRSYISTAQISSQSEMELLNNTATTSTYVGVFTYLPIINRN